MEEFLKGVMLGAVVGACVASVVVAKNKKLSGKIREGINTASEKLSEAKETLIDKMQECEFAPVHESEGCGFCNDDVKNKDQNKKSKN